MLDEAPNEYDTNRKVYVAWNGVTAAPPWSQAWGRARRRAPGGTNVV